MGAISNHSEDIGTFTQSGSGKPTVTSKLRDGPPRPEDYGLLSFKTEAERRVNYHEAALAYWRAQRDGDE